MTLPERSLATAQVQAGYDPRTEVHTAVPPIYQSAAFAFSSLAEARDLFALRKNGDIYSRAANPTVLVLEERIAALEGGIAAAGVASGQAAVALSLLALVHQGQHIVAASQLYGGTVDLLHDTFPDWGIEVTFVDQDDIDAWRAAIRPTTRVLFAESVANPLAQVLRVSEVAEVAHAAGLPLVIDNTVATPALQRPKEFGADIVVHSATKFLGGHGSTLGGVIVDLGTFDFTAHPERWPQLTAPYARTGGGSLVERFGERGSPFIALIKTKYVHDLGPTLSATSAFQLLQGVETLDLRLGRHSESAEKVASTLADHPRIAKVHHPSLPDSPWHAAALAYLPRGAASVFSVDLVSTGDADGDFALVEQFVERLRLLRLVANIGDARSMVAHPASMTHSHLTPDQRAVAGISETTVRLSIGLEDPDEIIADLVQALG
ncbi:Methionine gamma-lyase [Microbacterium ginsengisoli]|uniref:Methionine gamma-lyase n=1 Tax=Microbacterium ginsengisoli TaxID=400772 RepID=A0A0F0LNX2_9MICO|nr:aminotransferase class V-fold PLP-dependent enzyme [Microbacterium ginsengisoli]KJL34848.1 Methionine gamma-lyase [Microbacterium ginsengisoli]KJL35067.1 Methionine gamma-lyase [Microbacterium ginsengisoli]MBN9207656.1 O-acetylhomoserine aminocarboxypropyltransferase/cysteine synthase [Microbacterium ginsengisoli]HAN23936.1 O-acetylhomoserine aminocarboxypropyltransferase/cysteine synthase [Microbacterium ginsengisoli]